MILKDENLYNLRESTLKIMKINWSVSIENTSTYDNSNDNTIYEEFNNKITFYNTSKYVVHPNT